MLDIATEVIVSLAKGCKPHARSERIHEFLVGNFNIFRVNDRLQQGNSLLATCGR
jgi:hypothetical protein